ncbi:phage antirepressor, partial [Enterococcus faecium]
MNTPQIFNFEQNEVRTILVNDEPYFVGKDVASVLGYSNTKDALSRHVDLEDKMGSR